MMLPIDEHASGSSALDSAFPSRETLDLALIPGCGPVDVTNRPSDDAILAQQQDIRADVERMELVGDKEPLEALAAEYDNGSSVFRARIQSLYGTVVWKSVIKLQHVLTVMAHFVVNWQSSDDAAALSLTQRLGAEYSAFRRVRGDGNCFYRGFMFAYLEHFMHQQDSSSSPQPEQVLDIIKQSTAKLVSHGFVEYTFEDEQATLADLLASVSPRHAPQQITLDALVHRFRNPEVSNAAVMFLRFLTSCEIHSRTDFFEPFIAGMTDNNQTVAQFCRASVEVMGEESDHVHITALIDALKLPVRVAYLDGGMSHGQDLAEVTQHDFHPQQDDGTPALVPEVVLLYRPGHYDILYK
eukprot:jgi/Chlat1/5603/Chrsp369S05375